MSRTLRSANLFLAGVFVGLCVSALLLRLQTAPPTPVPVVSTGAGAGPALAVLQRRAPDPPAPPPPPAAQWAASQPPPHQETQRQNARGIALMQPAHMPEEPVIESNPHAGVRNAMADADSDAIPRAPREGDSLLNVPHEAYLAQRGGPLGPYVPIREPPRTVRLPRACCSTTTGGCLRTWLQEYEAIAFIHIGKAGGTMFDQVLSSMRTEQGCQLGRSMPGFASCTSSVANMAHCPLINSNMERIRQAVRLYADKPHTCPGRLNCLHCNQHADFTVSNVLIQDGMPIAPVAVIREPAKRIVSHFYFGRKLRFHDCMLPHNLSTYFKDPECLALTRTIWADGQSAVWWFAGVHPDMNWVNQRFPEEAAAERERLAFPGTVEDQVVLLRMAATNFHKFLWVGILERLTDSLDLFAFQGSLRRSSLTVRRSNTNGYPAPSEPELDTIRDLVQMDQAFYAYVVQVLEIRLDVMRQIKAQGASSGSHCAQPLENKAAFLEPVTFSYKGHRII